MLDQVVQHECSQCGINSDIQYAYIKPTCLRSPGHSSTSDTMAALSFWKLNEFHVNGSDVLGLAWALEILSQAQIQCLPKPKAWLRLKPGLIYHYCRPLPKA
jgi:hypothetical protein